MDFSSEKWVEENSEGLRQPEKHDYDRWLKNNIQFRKRTQPLRASLASYDPFGSEIEREDMFGAGKKGGVRFHNKEVPVTDEVAKEVLRTRRRLAAARKKKRGAVALGKESQEQERVFLLKTGRTRAELKESAAKRAKRAIVGLHLRSEELKKQQTLKRERKASLKQLDRAIREENKNKQKMSKPGEKEKDKENDAASTSSWEANSEVGKLQSTKKVQSIARKPPVPRFQPSTKAKTRRAKKKEEVTEEKAKHKAALQRKPALPIFYNTKKVLAEVLPAAVPKKKPKARHSHKELQQFMLRKDKERKKQKKAAQNQKDDALRAKQRKLEVLEEEQRKMRLASAKKSQRGNQRRIHRGKGSVIRGKKSKKQFVNMAASQSASSDTVNAKPHKSLVGRHSLDPLKQVMKRHYDMKRQSSQTGDEQSAKTGNLLNREAFQMELGQSSQIEQASDKQSGSGDQLVEIQESSVSDKPVDENPKPESDIEASVPIEDDYAAEWNESLISAASPPKVSSPRTLESPEPRSPSSDEYSELDEFNQSLGEEGELEQGELARLSDSRSSSSHSSQTETETETRSFLEARKPVPVMVDSPRMSPQSQPLNLYQAPKVSKPAPMNPQGVRQGEAFLAKDATYSQVPPGVERTGVIRLLAQNLSKAKQQERVLEGAEDSKILDINESLIARPAPKVASPVLLHVAEETPRKTELESVVSNGSGEYENDFEELQDGELYSEEDKEVAGSQSQSPTNSSSDPNKSISDDETKTKWDKLLELPQQDDGRPVVNISPVPSPVPPSSSASINKSESGPLNSHSPGASSPVDMVKQMVHSPGALRRMLLSNVQMLEALSTHEKQADEAEAMHALTMAQHETVEVAANWEAQQRAAQEAAQFASVHATQAQAYEQAMAGLKSKEAAIEHALALEQQRRENAERLEQERASVAAARARSFSPSFSKSRDSFTDGLTDGTASETSGNLESTKVVSPSSLSSSLSSALTGSSVGTGASSFATASMASYSDASSANKPGNSRMTKYQRTTLKMYQEKREQLMFDHSRNRDLYKLKKSELKRYTSERVVALNEKRLQLEKEKEKEKAGTRSRSPSRSPRARDTPMPLMPTTSENKARIERQINKIKKDHRQQALALKLEKYAIDRKHKMDMEQIHLGMRVLSSSSESNKPAAKSSSSSSFASDTDRLKSPTTRESDFLNLSISSFSRRAAPLDPGSRENQSSNKEDEDSYSEFETDSKFEDSKSSVQSVEEDLVLVEFQNFQDNEKSLVDQSIVEDFEDILEDISHTSTVHEVTLEDQPSPEYENANDSQYSDEFESVAETDMTAIKSELEKTIKSEIQQTVKSELAIWKEQALSQITALQRFDPIADQRLDDPDLKVDPADSGSELSIPAGLGDVADAAKTIAEDSFASDSFSLGHSYTEDHELLSFATELDKSLVERQVREERERRRLGPKTPKETKGQGARPEALKEPPMVDPPVPPVPPVVEEQTKTKRDSEEEAGLEIGIADQADAITDSLLKDLVSKLVPEESIQPEKETGFSVQVYDDQSSKTLPRPPDPVSSPVKSPENRPLQEEEPLIQDKDLLKHEIEQMERNMELVESMIEQGNEMPDGEEKKALFAHIQHIQMRMETDDLVQIQTLPTEAGSVDEEDMEFDYDWKEYMTRYVHELFDHVEATEGSVPQLTVPPEGRVYADTTPLWPIPQQRFLELEEAENRPEFLQILNKSLFDAVNEALVDILPCPQAIENGQTWLRQEHNAHLKKRRPSNQPWQKDELIHAVLDKVRRWDDMEHGPAVPLDENDQLELPVKQGWSMTVSERMDKILRAEMCEMESHWLNYERDEAEICFEIATLLLEDLLMDTVREVSRVENIIEEQSP